MEHRTETVPLPGGGTAEIATVRITGRDFAAGGASITDDHAVVYITSDAPRGPVTTWSGDKLGTYVETGSWRQAARGRPYRMRAVRVTLNDGRVYHGRYNADDTQAVKLRRSHP
jgi:hypothetical protein